MSDPSSSVSEPEEVDPNSVVLESKDSILSDDELTNAKTFCCEASTEQ